MPNADTLNKQFSILLVDDDADDLFALGIILESLNLNVVKAESGAEALRCLLKQDFAVIIMDLMMPRMNGFELAALIRERPQSRNTPLIFLTGYDLADARSIAGYADFSAEFLHKPVSIQDLSDKVKECLGVYNKVKPKA